MATQDSTHPRLVWHYTTGEKFRRIVEDHYLLPTTAGVEPPEKPILWFSADQVWEPTANKLILSPDGTLLFGTKETTRQMGRGLVRFGMSPARLHPWPKIAKKARMTNDQASDLERAAETSGSNPRNWYGTTQPIPLDRISRIEVEDGEGVWVTVRGGEV